MLTLSETAALIGQAAGWRNPSVEKDGVITFVLESLEFSLWKLGDRLTAFRADLGSLPSDEMEADYLTRRLAGFQLAKVVRPSVVSFQEGRFGLHQTLDLGSVSPEEIPQLCADFLNDLDWWHRNYSQS